MKVFVQVIELQIGTQFVSRNEPVSWVSNLPSFLAARGDLPDRGTSAACEPELLAAWRCQLQHPWYCAGHWWLYETIAHLWQNPEGNGLCLRMNGLWRTLFWKDDLVDDHIVGIDVKLC